jgi:hypothetical protein
MRETRMDIGLQGRYFEEYTVNNSNSRHSRLRGNDVARKLS